MSVAEFYNKFPSIVVETQDGIHDLEATDFERLCQAWAMETFPSAKVTRGPTNKGDQGVDIEVEVGGMTPMHIVIQAKCWDPKGPNVSIKVINETAGAAVAKNAGYGIVITSGGFTKEAKAQANRLTNEGKVMMTLLDGNTIWESLMQLPEYKRRLQEQQKHLSSPLVPTSLQSEIGELYGRTQQVFTNHNSFCFGSKIEQKITFFARV